MSFQVGLSASEDDLEVQGEIDFDFFDDDDTCAVNKLPAQESRNKEPFIAVTENGNEIADITDHVSRTSLVTVIPSPEDYQGNNCGLSPDLCTKSQNDDTDASSSLSTSASDVSTSLSDESLDNFEDGTDSMTDVTPLQSSCTSPVSKQEAESCKVELDKEHTNSISVPSTSSFRSEMHKKQGVKFITNVKTRKTPDTENAAVDALLKAIKTLKVNQAKPKVRNTPLASNLRHSKNMTFPNEAVRRIDIENQRLLKRINSQRNRPRPNYSPVCPKLASSAINRQRQKRQIELENLGLLKRLESSKPSRELNRTQLLKEYESRSPISSRSSLNSSRASSKFSSCRSSARSSGRSSFTNSHNGMPKARNASGNSEKL